MKYQNRSIQISCDGGAATGKSTGAKLVAKKYKLKFLSSGLLYRYASFLILKYKPKNKKSFLRSKFKSLNYKKIEKINLHKPEISLHSAEIAKINEVRIILKKFQKNFAKKYKKCCIEGRDISTKILPKSDVKFFFKCNLNIAAIRRFRELRKLGKKTTLKDVKKSIKTRDYSDFNRRISPLKRTKDSILINTSNLTKKACFLKIKNIIEKEIKY